MGEGNFAMYFTPMFLKQKKAGACTRGQNQYGHKTVCTAHTMNYGYDNQRTQCPLMAVGMVCLHALHESP